MKIILSITLLLILFTFTSFAFALAFPDKLRVVMDLGGPFELNIPRTEKYPNHILFYEFNSSKSLCLLPGCDIYQTVMDLTFNEKGVGFTGTIFAAINNNTIQRETRAIDVTSDSRYLKTFKDYDENGNVLNTTFVTRGTIDFGGMFDNGTEWTNKFIFNNSKLNFDTNKYVIDAYFQPPQ